MDITPLTPAASPVAAAELRAHLRLYSAEEDALLGDLLACAAAQFEHDTLHPVLSRNYAQTLRLWPRAIPLGRNRVTAVTAVYQLDESGTATALTGTRADLASSPARVLLASAATRELADGQTCGRVEFAAGWPDAASVPPMVRLALKLLAAHWYMNREAFSGEPLDTVPKGWDAVVGQYRLGLFGPWGTR